MWRAALDPSSGDTYYFHTESGETQWERPAGYVDPSGAGAGAERVAAGSKTAPAAAAAAVPQGNPGVAGVVDDRKLAGGAGASSSTATSGASGDADAGDGGASSGDAAGHGVGDAKLAGTASTGTGSKQPGASSGKAASSGEPPKDAGKPSDAEASSGSAAGAGEAAKPPHWVEYWDHASARAYYADSHSGRTTWEKPVVFVPCEMAEMMRQADAAAAAVGLDAPAGGADEPPAADTAGEASGNAAGAGGYVDYSTAATFNVRTGRFTAAGSSAVEGYKTQGEPADHMLRHFLDVNQLEAERAKASKRKRGPAPRAPNGKTWKAAREEAKAKRRREHVADLLTDPGP